MRQSVYLQQEGGEKEGLKLVYEYNVCNLVGENIKKYDWLMLDANQDTRCVAFYEKNDSDCDGKPVVAFTSNQHHHKVDLSLYGYFRSCKSTPSDGSPIFLRRGQFDD